MVSTQCPAVVWTWRKVSATTHIPETELNSVPDGLFLNDPGGAGERRLQFIQGTV
jgi:hypothetical protein